jgi:hypothetical protein
MDEGAFLLRYFGIKKALAAQFAAVSDAEPTGSID